MEENNVNFQNQCEQNPKAGHDNAVIAIVTSVIGLFVFSLVLGIVGHVYSNKAETAGNSEDILDAAKVISIIDIVVGVVKIIWVIIAFCLATAAFDWAAGSVPLM